MPALYGCLDGVLHLGHLQMRLGMIHYLFHVSIGLRICAEKQ
ncbi:hypothetical protein BVRB_5g124240 [Beta vulgaris subsp. vulgaris]|uniref:Uncharacterized protein n=1 Tax=Beta vulgaris subsp. vulgaris TaxID=3555 RepID=A0A0J8BCE2_BETVV|nr:hypothetical protein BVRB_5g124240 [Beta vulgaris subsp. vulgaris]